MVWHPHISSALGRVALLSRVLRLQRQLWHCLMPPATLFAPEGAVCNSFRRVVFTFAVFCACRRSSHRAQQVAAAAERCADDPMLCFTPAQALKPGDAIQSGVSAAIKPGNWLPLRDIPMGMDIFNIELAPGRGGQICRSAGCAAQVRAGIGLHCVST